jgi:hypothetical protein
MNDFHGKKRLRAESGVAGARFVDLGDARVVQTAEGLKLEFKSPESFRTSPSGLDDFEGNVAPWLILLGFVNRAHPAFAEKANDAITADLGRQLRRGAGSGRGFGRRECDVRTKRAARPIRRVDVVGQPVLLKESNEMPVSIAPARFDYEALGEWVSRLNWQISRQQREEMERTSPSTWKNADRWNDGGVLTEISIHCPKGAS